MTRERVIFKGTEQETMRLLGAIEQSCVDPDRCLKDAHGTVVQMCAAHRALHDQRFLDGVLCARRDLERLKRGEGLA